MAYRHVLEDLLDLRLPLLFRDLESKGGWVDRRSVGDFSSACWAHVGEGVARLRGPWSMHAALQARSAQGTRPGTRPC